MKDLETTSGELRLNLLLFAVGGVCFAVDAEQIDGMSEQQTEENDKLYRFHEMLGFDGEDVVYRAPTVLSVKSAAAGTAQVLIDNMEDMVEFSVNDIVPLPALIEPFAIKNGIWGVLKRGGNLTLLVDFYRIAKLHFDN